EVGRIPGGNARPKERKRWGTTLGVYDLHGHLGSGPRIGLLTKALKVLCNVLREVSGRLPKSFQTKISNDWICCRVAEPDGFPGRLPSFHPGLRLKCRIYSIRKPAGKRNRLSVLDQVLYCVEVFPGEMGGRLKHKQIRLHLRQPSDSRCRQHGQRPLDG